MWSRQVWKSVLLVVMMSLLSFKDRAYSQSGSRAPEAGKLAAIGRMTADTLCSTGRDHASGGCEDDALLAVELAKLGGRGESIAEVRDHVLEILGSGQGCAGWCQEANPDAARVFRSLHYQLDNKSPSIIERKRDDFGEKRLKYPWSAETVEYGGADSTIILNGNGAFFVHDARLSTSELAGSAGRPNGWHQVMLASYSGDTREARILILLHELGHIIGRLPVDDDTWNGGSSRNTREVLRYCGAEIDLAARKRRKIASHSSPLDTAAGTSQP